jgi:hypothetical protein
VEAADTYFDVDRYARHDLRIKLNGRVWTFPNDPDGGMMAALLRVETAVKNNEGIAAAEALDEGKRLILAIMRECNEGVPDDPSNFSMGAGAMLMVISFLSDGKTAAEAVADAIAGGLTPEEQVAEIVAMRESGEIPDEDEPEEVRPLAPSTTKRSSRSASSRGGTPATGKRRPSARSRSTSAKPDAA